MISCLFPKTRVDVEGWHARNGRGEQALCLPHALRGAQGVPPTGRAGVTLTEILFAILVMGVGLLSVLSLFPIGLLNVARAVQLSRAGAYAEGVLGDLQVQHLLAEERYRFGLINPPPPDPMNNAALPSSPDLNNPFIVDHGLVRDGINNDGAGGVDDFGDVAAGAIAVAGERGLPIAIDPLWLRARSSPLIRVVPPVPPSERLGVLFSGGTPVNSGLQRVMPTDGMNNPVPAVDRLVDAFDDPVPALDGVPDGYPDGFNLSPLAPLNPAAMSEQFLPLTSAQQIFGSRDDITYRETDPDPTINEERRWLPLNDATGVPLREQKYTSLVTAYLPDAGDPTRYEASVAVFFNREFPTPVSIVPFGVVPAGERTLLAYYLPQPGTGAGNLTLPVQPSNQMILMWPANEPAPEVPREGWILDASYDANAARWNTNAVPPGPGREFWPHRAFWYKIVGRGEPQTGYVDTTGAFVPFTIGATPAVRQLITLDRPVREVTPSPVAPNTITYVFAPGDPNFTPLATQPANPLASPYTVNVAVLFTGLVGVYERTLTVPKP